MDPVTPTALLTARSALGAADTRLIAVFEPAGTAVALRQGVEVARSAQQQRIDRLLEMAVRAFDRTDLVRYAPISAGRLHAVMRAQCLVAARLVLPRVVVEIAEGGRQAVAAMLRGSAAERPQRILQALGQCYEALAAEHDMSMLPAGPLRPT